LGRKLSFQNTILEREGKTIYYNNLIPGGIVFFSSPSQVELGKEVIKNYIFYL